MGNDIGIAHEKKSLQVTQDKWLAAHLPAGSESEGARPDSATQPIIEAYVNEHLRGAIRSPQSLLKLFREWLADHNFAATAKQHFHQLGNCHGILPR